MSRWWAILLLACVANLRADEALQYFTKQASAALQAQLGLSLTNIPIYSPTNSSIRYSAAIHYALQGAADAYDATTPATNDPSVFRPMFGWQGGNLFIVGYTNVTTDFDAQISTGFKDIADRTIGLNDNVWGVPWVVGTKDYVPAFNEYSYASQLVVARPLEVTRPCSECPPNFTNVFYDFQISNVFGIEAWNNSQRLNRNLVLVASNQISWTWTNNYDWGTNFTTEFGNDYAVNSWPGAGRSAPSFVSFFLTNFASLPTSYWSPSTSQLITSNYLASDFTQIGWPIYDWTLNVTNSLMYVL